MRWIFGSVTSLIVLVLLYPTETTGSSAGYRHCESSAGISLLSGKANCGVAGEILPVAIALAVFLAVVLLVGRRSAPGAE